MAQHNTTWLVANGVIKSLPWRNPSAGFDVSPGHVEGADADGVLIVHGQEISTHKQSLYISGLSL